MAYFVNVASGAVSLLRQPALGETTRLQNVGNVTAFLSSNSGVTATTGFPLTPGSKIEWISGANTGTPSTPIACYAITASSGTVVSVGGGTP
jgi:hypothetical protein